MQPSKRVTIVAKFLNLSKVAIAIARNVQTRFKSVSEAPSVTGRMALAWEMRYKTTLDFLRLG
jgi:hypothetical protein